MNLQNDNIIPFNSNNDKLYKDSNRGSHGGGGGMDGLITRIENLEKDVREIRTDVSTLKTDTAFIKGTLQSEFAAIHREMSTKAELRETENRLLVRFTSIIIVIITLASGFLAWYLRPIPQAAMATQSTYSSPLDRNQNNVSKPVDAHAVANQTSNQPKP
ncbi:MAG: hypothetical protein HQM01_04450 [Magnetococcales bacterium]|nr:hypothetical protein [Magnetococcales bacterium]